MIINGDECRKLFRSSYFKIFILVEFTLSKHLLCMLSDVMYFYWYPDRCLTEHLYPQEIVRINYLFLLLLYVITSIYANEPLGSLLDPDSKQIIPNRSDMTFHNIKIPL